MVTDILKVSYKKLKNKRRTVIPIFGIKINTNLFKVYLLIKKIEKTITKTGIILF